MISLFSVMSIPSHRLLRKCRFGRSKRRLRSNRSWLVEASVAQLVGGEVVGGAGGVGGFGPPGGDYLAAGVEGDAFGAVDVRVAEERSLPAAEGVVGHGHGQRHIDADHAHCDAALELP